jgi:hypothetical protein
MLIPVSTLAMSRIKDADAVIILRNGNPCFSYPQDEEIRKRPYSFARLSVSKNTGGGMWDIGIASSDREGLLEPNSPDTCIEYGRIHPGTEVLDPAKSLQLNTPYHVIIRVTEPPGERFSYKRLYYSNFCIVHNEKGELMLVGVSFNSNSGWRCLKPGESSERGFWDRLFGQQ